MLSRKFVRRVALIAACLCVLSWAHAVGADGERRTGRAGPNNSGSGNQGARSQTPRVDRTPPSRPSMPNTSRSVPSARPDTGNAVPRSTRSVPSEPRINREPVVRNNPPAIDRPSNRSNPNVNPLNGNGNAAARSSRNNDRPAVSQRPAIGDKPANNVGLPRNLRNDDRPSVSNRPNIGDKPNGATTTPRTRPSDDRPNVLNKPSIGDKPLGSDLTLRNSRNNDRPIPNRPNIGDKPNGSDGTPRNLRNDDRPIPNRPNIGDKPNGSDGTPRNLRNDDRPVPNRPNIGDKPNGSDGTPRNLRNDDRPIPNRPNIGDKPNGSDGTPRNLRNDDRPVPNRPNIGDKPNGSDGTPRNLRNDDRPVPNRPNIGDKPNGSDETPRNLRNDDRPVGRDRPNSGDANSSSGSDGDIDGALRRNRGNGGDQNVGNREPLIVDGRNGSEPGRPGGRNPNLDRPVGNGGGANNLAQGDREPFPLINRLPGNGFNPNFPTRPNRPNLNPGYIGGYNFNHYNPRHCNTNAWTNLIVNVNVNNNYWANRPGFYNVNWGIGNRYCFNDYWYGYHVRSFHRNWYNGCWRSNWCNNWYVPLSCGLSSWVVGNNSCWGYGYSYYNPYFVQTTVPVYNYSRPIIVYYERPVVSERPATDSTVTASETLASRELDLAVEDFGKKNYLSALVRVESALKYTPDDPLLHEFRALCMYATGQYDTAAAILNSLLASAPGMDWTSMSRLYPDVDEYTRHLRQLEDHVRLKSDDSAAQFVLAYHYLVLDEDEAAARALRKVIELQPKDITARRMLANIEADLAPLTLDAPRESVERLPSASETAKEAEGKPVIILDDGAEPKEAKEAATPTTNIVGLWTAKTEQSSIELTVNADMTFVWKSTVEGKLNEMKGKLAVEPDSVLFQADNKEQLAGQVISHGPDKFQFVLLGAAENDQGLMFERKFAQ